VTKASLRALLDQARGSGLADLTFLDLRTEVVEREIAALAVAEQHAGRPASGPVSVSASSGRETS